MKETNNDVILKFLDEQVEESQKFLDEKGERVVQLIKSKDYAGLVDIIPEYLENLTVHMDRSGMRGWFEEDYVKRGVEY